MLTRRGRSSPWRDHQPDRVEGSSDSPPKITQRSASSPPPPDSSSSPARARNAEGVWLSTVTRCSCSVRRKSAGERLSQYGTTTRRLPYDSAPHSSQTEKSKASEWNSVQTSCGPKPNQPSVAPSSRIALAWLTPTPFGCPVEPEV